MFEKKSVLTYFKIVLFPLPLPETLKGFFSDIHCVNLAHFLEVNITISWWSSMTDFPWNCYAELLAVHQFQFKFSNLGTGSHSCSCSWVSAPLSHDCFHPFVSPVLDAEVYSMSSSLLGSQEHLLMFQSFGGFTC